MSRSDTSIASNRQVVADADRLAALGSTGLLDSDAEPSFDRLTRLAAKFLGTPVALVSLVDADRQFFKSCVGLPEPWATRRQTPLTHSFCQLVVSTQEPLVIDDARLDPRVKDNGAIADLGVIAYLGIPLAINGQVIGSFCAIDGKPRAWISDDIAMLRDLAESVVTEIRLRAEHGEIERQRHAADDARLRLNNALAASSIATWTWDIPNDRVVADANLARLFSVSPDRAWISDDIAMLRDLAESVVTEIRLRAEHGEIERQRHAADDARLRLNNALAASSIATWTWDIPNDRVVADANLARLFSVSPEDAAGGPLSRYIRAIHPDDVERVSRAIGEAVANGSTIDEEYRVVQADGSARWIVARGKVERDSQSGALSLSGAVVDITERKQTDDALRDSQERYRTLFSSMDEGFCVIEMIHDAGGIPVDYRYLEVNPAFEQQTGWRDVVGKRVCELAPGLESYWFQAFDSVARTGEPVRLENEAKAVGDRWYDVYATRLGEADQVKVALIFKDITGRKRAEMEREGLVEQLREADARKDDFLAMLAHELRNPLAAITNASNLMAMTDEADMTAYCKDTIARQSKHLLRLINDLLDVSRISHGNINLITEPIDAAAAIESAVQTVRPLAEERQHRLDIQLDRGRLWVNADPTRLEQIVINLLNNAAKYSDNNGHIWLTARHEGDEIVIRVKDAGIGIAAERLPEMFELFAQADRSSARSEGGLGIGLTLVKRLVEMHGGTITASSEGLRTGSEFVVRLPAAKRPVKAPTVASGSQDALKSARILVVDDNADTAQSMATLLNLMGHEVTTARSGPEAIDAAQAHRPEVVLLDIGLPGMDGFEVAKRLRQAAHGKNAVIVAVSGYSQELDRRRGEQAGFDHHLVKPVDFDALRSFLAERGFAEADPQCTQTAQSLSNHD